jgi:flavin-dependent dehydrogenase
MLWKFNHRKLSALCVEISLLICFRITFTYGGIAIDTEGRARTADRQHIPGLLVAGVDAGGFSNLGYAGGLALAFVTGLWAARAIAKELNLPEPQLPPANSRDIQPEDNSLVQARL